MRWWTPLRVVCLVVPGRGWCMIPLYSILRCVRHLRRPLGWSLKRTLRWTHRLLLLSPDLSIARWHLVVLVTSKTLISSVAAWSDLTSIDWSLHARMTSKWTLDTELLILSHLRSSSIHPRIWAIIRREKTLWRRWGPEIGGGIWTCEILHPGVIQ